MRGFKDRMPPPRGREPSEYPGKVAPSEARPLVETRQLQARVRSGR